MKNILSKKIKVNTKWKFLFILLWIIILFITISSYYKFIINNKELFNNNIEYGVIYARTDNIGDDIQTLAAIEYLKKKGITKYNFVDRENLHKYNGKKLNVIMNGWYLHNIKNFPPSKNINPKFISIHIDDENLIKKNINYFKIYEPIGCRDIATVKKFEKYKIKAYFTGCLTLLFNEVKNKTNKKYLVDISKTWQPDIGKAELDIDLSKYKNYEKIEAQNIIPKNIFNNIEKRLEFAEKILDKYRYAELIITSRLHCVLPCRAFNTDCIFIHNNYYTNARFSGFQEIINGDKKLHNKKKGNKKAIEEMKKKLLNININ